MQHEAIKIIDIAILIISVFALVVSVRACSIAESFNKDSLYITTVNTRIETCTALSSFHKDLGSPTSQLTDMGKEVTAPAERSDREASLARALTLCLVGYRDVSDVHKCVDAANNSSNYRVHDIVAPGTGSTPPKGADIPAC